MRKFSIIAITFLCLSLVLVFIFVQATDISVQTADIHIYVNQPAAGLEFLIELPSGVEFVSFTPNESDEMPNIQYYVTDTTDDGIWIGLFADWNGYYGNNGDIIAGQLTVRSSEERPDVPITNVTANHYTDVFAVISTASSGEAVFPLPEPDESSELSAEIYFTPKASSIRPSPTPESSPTPTPSPSPSPSPTPSPTPEPTPTPEPCPFIDLYEVQWASTAIEFLWREYGFSGIDETHFAPNSTLTRAQFARFISVAMNIPSAEYKPDFYLDIHPEAWYYNDIMSLTAIEVLNGYPNGYFLPNKAITREEMAVLLHRILSKLGYDVVPVRPFALSADISSAGKWTTSSIRSLYRAGFIEGVSSNRFSPKTSATRAQAAVILYRVILAIRQDGNPHFLAG